MDLNLPALFDIKGHAIMEIVRSKSSHSGLRPLSIMDLHSGDPGRELFYLKRFSRFLSFVLIIIPKSSPIAHLLHHSHPLFCQIASFASLLSQALIYLLGP
jgi:hypothetical protein